MVFGILGARRARRRSTLGYGDPYDNGAGNLLADEMRLEVDEEIIRDDPGSFMADVAEMDEVGAEMDLIGDIF